MTASQPATANSADVTFKLTNASDSVVPLDSASAKFSALASKLVSIPKREIDAERKRERRAKG